MFHLQDDGRKERLVLEAAADGEGSSEVAAVLAERNLRPVEVDVAADHVAFAERFAVVVKLKVIMRKN